MDNSTYPADLRGPGIVNTVGNADLSSISPGSEASQPKLRVVIDLKWNEQLNVVLPQNIRRNGLTYQESATILNATLGVSVAGVSSRTSRGLDFSPNSMETGSNYPVLWTPASWIGLRGIETGALSPSHATCTASCSVVAQCLMLRDG